MESAVIGVPHRTLLPALPKGELRSQPPLPGIWFTPAIHAARSVPDHPQASGESAPRSSPRHLLFQISVGDLWSVSGFGSRVSGFGFRVSGFRFRGSGFGPQMSCFGFEVRGREGRAQLSKALAAQISFGDLWRVSGFGIRVSGFGFRGSGFGFRDSGFGFQTLDLGFRVSGCGPRIWCFEFQVWGQEGRAQLS